MKKVYTKPVMESEEFVSNEYVAACWTITCTNQDFFSKGCGFVEGKDDLLSEYEAVSSGSGMYTGEIGGKSGCLTVTKDMPIWLKILAEIVGAFNQNIKDDIYDNWGNWATANPERQYHPVEVTEGWDNHPNASV